MTGPTEGPAQEIARTKLQQIFRFLREFNQLRNPIQREISKQPWLLWFRDLPHHPAIERGHPFAPAGDGGPQAEGADFILRVRRPEVTHAPEPPAGLLPWLKPGWASPDSKPEVEPVRTETQPDGSLRTVRFADDPERVRRLQQYAAAHGAWADLARPARAAEAIYRRLYDLYSQLERESERLELMVGDGLLTWHPPGAEPILHPILLQSLVLSFDPEVPAFTLRETEQPPELFTALVADVASVQAAALARCREELEQGGYHPLGAEETNGFFRRTVSQLSPNGRFAPTPGPSARSDAPFITRDPVLFLRHRSLGFAQALERILADLPAREEIPAAFTRIVGIEAAAQSPVDGPGETVEDSPNGEDEEILLSKAANPEQLQIAKRLERHGAVLVQGPPGTGKTHTIANLLGHLLAQGKSVLVTSHTAKALKVLRDQVVKPLQPLCVSVVDDSSGQMEAAIDMITDRLSTANADQLEREAAQLRQQRIALLRRLREARTRLRDARMDEYRPVTVAGTSYEPAQAARHLRAGRGVDDWIPGPVTLGEPLPLSAGEVLDLYRTNRSVSAADEGELTAALPDPASLQSPSAFARLVAERAALRRSDHGLRADLWLNPPPDQEAATLRDLLARMQAAVAPIRSREPWWLAAALAGKEGAPQEETWRDLIEEIHQVGRQAVEAERIILRLGPELPPDWPVAEVMAVLEAVLAHLRRGGRLNAIQLFLHKDWRRLIEAARTQGRRPSTLEEFEALHQAAALRIARDRLAQRWQRQMAVLGAPDAADLGSEPERACRQFVEEIERCLAWFREVWEPLVLEVRAQGLLWYPLLGETPIDLSQYGDLHRLHRAVTERLPPVLEARIASLRLQELEGALARLERSLALAGGSDSNQQGRIVMDLRAAVRQQDAAAYEAAFERLVTVWNKREDLARRRTLLTKLEGAAPAWAAAVRTRGAIHGAGQPPGDPEAAWLWRQLHDELERRSRVQLDELQRQIAHLTDELHRLTAQLVERKAWAGQVRRTTLSQRLALNGWKELIRRAGKRTGRRAPAFLAEARRLMPLCQSAVPVWIMPLSRVVENFDPTRNRFDVVIIDEASQSDMLALVALYLGKQVVVVGDHEQVSPLAVGLDYDRVKQLIEIHLTGVPNHLLFDGQSSIYDLAKTAYEPVCLLEHFRCVSPIIQFSNHLSYNGKIRPLRDASQVRRRPATVAYRVDGAAAEGGANRREAVAVASLLLAASEQPEYGGASFGVISLLGSRQARLVDQLLHRFMEPKEYTQRRVRCGDAADFQGDERDVIFLSMVDVPTGRGPLALRREGANQMFKQRFNVAASRARDQLWVVHSLNPATDLQGEDIRLRLIKHAENPAAVDQAIAEGTRRAESEFERQVITRLVEAGYRVVPQWQVGAYRIDIVVVDGHQRVAIECDGDRWHTDENLREDMARQAFLERLGWRFVRIRGSQFFRDPEATMGRVLGRLQELGIRPAGPIDAAADLDEVGEELRQRIIRRAAEIRRAWLELDEDLRDGEPAGEAVLPAADGGPRTVTSSSSSSHRPGRGTSAWG